MVAILDHEMVEARHEPEDVEADILPPRRKQAYWQPRMAAATIHGSDSLYEHFRRMSRVELQGHTNIRWRILAMLMGLCLISHVNRVSMSVAGTDRIMEQFHVEPTRMGVVYSAFLLVYSICMIPGGLFIDRFGPRLALMVVGFGSAVMGALTGVMGWAFSGGAQLLLALMLVRGTMGLLSAPLHPAAARAIGNWFPFAQRSLANGIVTCAAIIGVAVSYPGFGALIKWLDWPGAFLVTAGITTLLAGLWTFQATDQPAQHPRASAAEKEWIGTAANAEATSDATQADGWSALCRDRSLLLITLSYAAVGYFQYLFVYWMQFYFDKVLHLGTTASKYYAGILQLALAAGMPLGGWLSGRLALSLGVRRGRALVSGLGMGASALLLGFGVLARDPVWIVSWFALAHATLGASEGPFWASAVDIGGNKGGTAAAICNTGGNVGGMLAPVITPWVSQHLGWPWGIGLGGVICLLGALCWFGIDPRCAQRTMSEKRVT
jgi:sugar phosphate permease